MRAETADTGRLALPSVRRRIDEVSEVSLITHPLRRGVLCDSAMLYILQALRHPKERTDWVWN